MQARTAALADLPVDVLLASVARGQLLYRGATYWQNLAAGTSGHFLKAAGAGADPAWAALTTLEVANALAGGSVPGSVNFTGALTVQSGMQVFRVEAGTAIIDAGYSSYGTVFTSRAPGVSPAILTGISHFNDDAVYLSSSKGPCLKSPDGHYWRATISNGGVVTWTDLGTVAPV